MKKIILILTLLACHHFAYCELFFSKQDGDWTDPNTWTNSSGVSRAPLPTDLIVVHHNVVLNGTTPYTHNVGITVDRGGHLTINRPFIFSKSGDQNIEIQIRENSTLEINAAGNNAFTLAEGSILRTLEYGAKLLVKNLVGNNTTGINSIVNNGQIYAHFGLIETSYDIVNNIRVKIFEDAEMKVGTLSDASFIDADYTANPGSQTIVNGHLRIEDDLFIKGATTTVCNDAGGPAIIHMGQDEVQSSIVFSNGATEETSLCKTVTVVREVNPLPIRIISFKVSDNSLTWDVFEERIMGYNIELSSNTESWETIGSIESKGDGRHIYEHKIKQSGYYRLKVLSLEEVEYSSIVYYNGLEIVGFFPNFVQQGSFISFYGEKIIEAVEIINENGIVVQKGALDNNGQLKINQAPGVYIVRTKGNQEQIGRLIVN